MTYEALRFYIHVAILLNMNNINLRNSTCIYIVNVAKTILIQYPVIKMLV